MGAFWSRPGVAGWYERRRMAIPSAPQWRADLGPENVKKPELTATSRNMDELWPASLVIALSEPFGPIVPLDHICLSCVCGYVECCILIGYQLLAYRVLPLAQVLEETHIIFAHGSGPVGYRTTVHFELPVVDVCFSFPFFSFSLGARWRPQVPWTWSA